VVFQGSTTNSMSSKERLKLLLFSLIQYLEPKLHEKRESLISAYDHYFEKSDDVNIRHSIAPPTVIQFIKDNIGEESVVISCLKACIHPITIGIIRLKDALTSFYPTKDCSWDVNVEINSDHVKIVHLRHEQHTNGLFQVQWKMSLSFGSRLKDLLDVSLFVTDLIFHEDTKEPTRYELQQLLKDYLPAAPWGGKSSVVLPSFVDISNQQLAQIPSQVFDMANLQTLYLHMNQVDEIPDVITKLTNLQVLYLNQNKLTQFPTIVCSMPSIRELHLGRNRITTIPPEIGKMQGLRELSLSYNILAGPLPKELLSLINLKKLYLHNNYLEDVPPELSDLPHLKVLQIHNNQKMSGDLSKFGPEDSEDLLKFLRAKKT